MLLYIQVKHREDSFNAMGYTPEDKKLNFYEQSYDCSFFMYNKDTNLVIVSSEVIIINNINKDNTNLISEDINRFICTTFYIPNDEELKSRNGWILKLEEQLKRKSLSLNR